MALTVAGLVFLLACGGFAYWRGSRFPARSEPLAGMPVELRVQSGVKPRELRAIRGGLRFADRFIGRTLGRTVRGPVEARVARSNGCRPFQSRGALVGQAEHGFMCIDTANLSWQWLILKDFEAATSVSAHEYVHVLQSELGCLPRSDHPRFRWLIEGMADYLAWRSLVVAGRVTDARVEREIRQDGALSSWLGPLSRYERQGGRDQAYALWHLAIRRLLHESVAVGTAPPDRREIALYRFCERVRVGRSWRSAFRQSFGFPVSQFYSRFEAARRRGSLSPG